MEFRIVFLVDSRAASGLSGLFDLMNSRFVGSRTISNPDAYVLWSKNKISKFPIK